MMASALPSSSSDRLDATQQEPLICSLKNEVKGLTSRVQLLDSEKGHLEMQLNKSQMQHVTTLKETDERLEDQAQRYEAKITELHSVIAELSRKLESHKIKVIREEDEDEDDDDRSNCSKDTGSGHGSSNNNNPNESCTDNEDVSFDFPIAVTDYRGSPATAAKKVSNDSLQHSAAGKAIDCFKGSDGSSPRLKKKNKGSEVVAGCDDQSERIRRLAQLQDEVHLLRAENEALHDQIGYQEAELNKTKASVGSLREERDRLRRKIRELHGKLQSFQSQGSQGSQTASPTRSRCSNVNSATGECSPTRREEAPIAKIAERVKLKRVESGDRHISGSEISSLGVASAKVVEHLVQHLQEESNTQEIFQALYSSGSHVSENRIREFEVETERLNSRIEHLKSQNDLLSLTLEESKMNCDRLSVMIGKYESNNTALQLALNCSDQALEGCEALLRLVESEMSLVVAKCHANGIATYTRTSCDTVNGEGHEVLLKRTQEVRKCAEAVAKRILQRMDRKCRIGCGVSCSDRPWEDLSSQSHTTSTISSGGSSYDGDLTKMDEQRLRDYIIQLKNERSLVRMTIMELESVHIDPFTREPSSSTDAQKLDLENAVLMQELMAIKEEKAELKAQVYLLEKERATLELRLNGREAQEQAYIAHIEHLKYEVKEQQQLQANDVANSDGHWESQCLDQSEDLSQNLVEALHREKKLKGRIQELVTTLEKVTRNSDLRHHQSAEFVHDLKRTNGALISAFEKSKKKYQSKLKRLEHQMLTLTERHTTQVRILQQRIGLLEDQISNQNLHVASETSL